MMRWLLPFSCMFYNFFNIWKYFSQKLPKVFLFIFFVIFIYLVLQEYLKQMGAEENFRLVF